MTSLSAGAGASEVVIPAALYPVDGFTTARDALQARVLLLDSGSRRLALAVADLTAVPDQYAGQLRDIIGQACGASPDDVIVGASHTFSAPHIGPLPAEIVCDAMARSAASARRALRPARVGGGTGTCHANVNRDVMTRDGWWHGADDGGVSDKSLAVIRIDDLRGHPIAVLMNYAVQSSVMSESRARDGGKLVTADLAGAACRHVERQYGDGTVALFLVGAAGDQAPYLTASRHTLSRHGNHSRIDVGEAGYLLVELLGERLGTEAVRVSEGIAAFQSGAELSVVSARVEVTGQAIPARTGDIRPARTYDFQVTGMTEVPVWVVRIGDIVLAGLRPELSSATGLQIKARSPHPLTLVVTMVNGGAKYMPDQHSYDKVTYEAMNSRYARGSAEITASKIAAILDDLKGSP